MDRDASSLISQERERLHGLISAWLIPSVPPPAWRCAAATVIAVAAAILMRIALLGLSGGVGATQPFFPAMVLVTLYAGWTWGLVPIACGAAFGWWLWGGRYGEGLSEDEIATMVIFLTSAVVTTVVAEVENIGPGTSRDMTADLAPGTYEIACKPGQTGDGIRAQLTVTGGAECGAWCQDEGCGDSRHSPAPETSGCCHLWPSSSVD